VKQSVTPVLKKRMPALATTATTAAEIPPIADCTDGRAPKRTYAQAMGRIISIAGRMKQVPATIRPG